MKMKACTVCARAQASIFMVFWQFSPKKIAKLLKKCERWPNKWSKVKTLEDKPRSGWPFFHKLCEKYYPKCCKYMRNNSTKQKSKKTFLLHIIDQSFEHNGMGIIYQKKLENLEEQKAVHTSCKHGVRRICKLYTKRGPAGKLTWCEPLETIWIIVDETTYKDPAPKTLDELRQWLRFAWKNVTLDTLWELVHSIPHCLENVRNIEEDILFTNILVIQC